MRWLLLACAALPLLDPWPARALEPAEVVVVANSFVTGSVDLARYYMEQRGIPRENLLRISTTNKEECSRQDYDEEIAAPIREFLHEQQGNKAIRCLVTVYGVPLRVAPPELSRADRKTLARVQQELAAGREQLKGLPDSQGEAAGRLQQQNAALDAQVKALDNRDQGAAVDSELTLLRVDSYPLQEWVANPFFVGFQQKRLSVDKAEVLLVARLDGPTMQIARRIIDDSISAEAAGLGGIAYFDARWPQPDAQNKLEGYAFYDNSLHLAAERVKTQGKLKVVVNDKPELFHPGEAPQAALYAGWYSLNRYVDAFDWVPGAIGYHIASGECVTLRAGQGNGWCKGMLEDGAAATVGPVAEPYVQAFPVPEIFFSFLIDGYYTLAEAYFLSLPYLSWQMVLVGDPLYRPFKVRHVRSEE